jgi:DNA-binding beta-propeller fold protein YncE
MKPSLLLTLLALALAVSARAEDAKPVSVPLGAPTLRLDDYYFDTTLKKIVVPAGRTGKLVLIDPETRSSESIEIFPVAKTDVSTAGAGITSADGGEGLIFASNRNDQNFYVVDPALKKVIAKGALESSPDYIRYSSPTREIWVTEPKKSQIEIFSLSASTAQRPIEPHSQTFIRSTKGEYEALQVDITRKRAYSNQAGETVSIDLQTRKILATWKNGCKEATGLALDGERGFLMVACREGRVAVLDVKDGRTLSSLKAGDGVDIIAYVPGKSLLYIPGGKSQTLTTASLNEKGELALLGKPVASVKGGHCVAADPLGGAWLCDGQSGNLLYYAPPQE